MVYSEDGGFDDLEEGLLDDISLNTMTIADSAHAQALFKNEETLEQVMNEIIAFLQNRQ